jgi:hypothetical protein
MWTAILSREDVVVVSKAIYDFLAFIGSPDGVKEP